MTAPGIEPTNGMAVVLGLMATLVTTSCATPYGAPLVAAPEPVPTAESPVQGKHTDHVIIISVDGLRPDAIRRFGARTLQRMVADGSHTFEATTVKPSSTLPSHTSMLTGTDPETHGVGWNDERLETHGHVVTPTIFAAAKAAGFHTAAFFSKSKFQHLAVPGTLDYAQVPAGWPGKWLADRTIDGVERYLETERPNLLFVHVGEPDFAGHVFGWMSDPYGWAVRQADEEIGELLDAADEAFGAGAYTVLITADHGGHGRGHGSEDPRDVTIPWIAWGKGVSPGVLLEPGIRTMDTAATALWLLGVEQGPESVGVAVTAAFVPVVGTVRVAETP